jgi:hypothetical protein
MNLLHRGGFVGAKTFERLIEVFFSIAVIGGT